MMIKTKKDKINEINTKIKCKCGCEWRHMIAVAMNITTKRLIIHEAESTHKYHHKHPLESFRNPQHDKEKTETNDLQNTWET